VSAEAGPRAEAGVEAESSDGADAGAAGRAGANRRRLLLAVPFGLAAAGGLGFWAMLRGMRDGSYDPRGVPSALLGRPAPEFALPAVAGVDLPPLRSGDLRDAGGPTVVNVWASWCVPCVIEHPQLMALARDGVRVLGVSHKDRPADAARFLAQRGNPFQRLGADADGRVSVDWGVYGVPETFLVDRGGIVRWRWAGPLTPDTLQAELLPLLRRYA